MIDPLALDRWAATGRDWLHRLPAGVKLGAVAGVIALLVATQQVTILVSVYALLLLVLLTARLPLLLLALSVLPVIMSGVFAISRFGAGWEALAAIVLKGAISSLMMLMLAASTPHTQLLRLARRVLPNTLADMLYLGYRSLFIILSRGLAARDAVRLRGGPAPIARRLHRGAVVGALAVLRATELASDQYAALQLRSGSGVANQRHRMHRQEGPVK